MRRPTLSAVSLAAVVACGGDAGADMAGAYLILLFFLAAFAAIIVLLIKAVINEIRGPRQDHAGTRDSSTQRQATSAKEAGKVPKGGLPVRSVANRNSRPTGRIKGGSLVRVIERSGIWVRIETTEGNQRPVWVERGALKPAKPPKSQNAG